LAKSVNRFENGREEGRPFAGFIILALLNGLIGAALFLISVNGFYSNYPDDRVPAPYGLIAGGCNLLAAICLAVAPFRRRKRVWQLTLTSQILALAADVLHSEVAHRVAVREAGDFNLGWLLDVIDPSFSAAIVSFCAFIYLVRSRVRTTFSEEH
jgi:hypothetical protein